MAQKFGLWLVAKGAIADFGSWQGVMKAKNYELFRWHQMSAEIAFVEERMKEIQKRRDANNT